MARPHRFQVGDRVRTVRKLPRGSSGTIVRVFETADCSDVQVDAYPGYRLIAHSDLEAVERAAEAGQA